MIDEGDGSSSSRGGGRGRRVRFVEAGAEVVVDSPAVVSALEEVCLSRALSLSVFCVVSLD